jgi:hypothetical protein
LKFGKLGVCPKPLNPGQFVVSGLSATVPGRIPKGKIASVTFETTLEILPELYVNVYLAGGRYNILQNTYPESERVRLHIDLYSFDIGTCLDQDERF